MIEILKLTKRYGDFTAVDDIDLLVPRGELFGFLGPNGAGKTTTLRMIAGILKPTSGTIRVAGVDVATDPIVAKSKLGFIPDRPFIYEKLTAGEFLRFHAGLYAMDERDIDERIILSAPVRALLKSSAEKLNLSPRSYHRTIKTARTIADLADSNDLHEEHVLEALQYRVKI